MSADDRIATPKSATGYRTITPDCAKLLRRAEGAIRARGVLKVCENANRTALVKEVFEGMSVYPSREDVKQRVIKAICALYRYDRELLDVDANERSITHKLAEHLQREFPAWHVDCEYNRVGRDTKKLAVDVSKPEPDDIEARTVFPDIIVHRRMTSENLLIMEVKKVSGRNDTGDVNKLKRFTEVPEYQYKYGLLLKLKQDGASELELYKNGKPCECWTGDLQRILKELGYGG